MTNERRDASRIPVPADWEAIVCLHLARYPMMTAQDLCKLVHQGTFGPAHAMVDERAVRARLRDEIARMGDGPPAPMVEPIAPGAVMVRVHLRPFVDAGGAVDALASAFIASAAGMQGDASSLDRAIEAVSDALARCEPSRVAAWLDDVERWRARGTPAVHHSADYAAAVRPAYRVVTGALAAPLVASLDG